MDQRIEQTISSDSIEMVAFGWLLTLAIAVGGWIYHARKSRQLQRKQLAITLLSQNRFEEEWVSGLKAVFYVLNHDSKYDWEKLASTYFGSGALNSHEQELMDHLKTVLNYLEFIAVAVLNKAADEYIVRKAYEGHYLRLYTETGNFFKEARTYMRDDEIWVNLCALAEKWRPKPQAAKPTP